MRRMLLALAFAAATMFGAVDAGAQVKLRTYQGPKLNGPVIRVIPPSLALNRALMLSPNAKALGVKLKGSHYIVKLKQGNQVRQIQVDAATGDVSQ